MRVKKQWIKMHRGSTRMKMQHGLRCIEDQDVTKMKMQHGSRCNMDQDATKIKMQKG